MDDKLGDMAEDTIEKAGGAEKAKQHVSKGADAADRATGGKHKEQVDKAEAGADSAVDKYAKKNKRQ